MGLFLRISIIIASTERRDTLAAVNLTDTWGIAVRIFQHLINKLHLNNLVTTKQVGVLGCVTAEHLLQLPSFMVGFEEFIIVTTLLGLFEISPIEHLHKLPVVANEEHGQRCRVVLLNDTVDDSSHRILTVFKGLLPLLLTAHHHCHQANGQEHQFLHNNYCLILIYTPSKAE